ncbi:MAG: phospholipase D-like domain-containing protein, partial [bacterium]|nr:phospholipase D-like domain-containing protein [bacterium]
LKTEEERAQIRLGSQLKPIVDAAQEELLVSTPYFVPQDTGVEYFGELKEKGLDVKVLTNSLLSNDVMVVHSGYAKYRKPLLEKGVRLFELKPSGVVRQIKGIKKLTESSASSLHAKTFVLDGRVLFVGSMNLDPRAVDKNTESGIVVKSPELSSEVTKKIQVLSLPINSYQVMLRKDYEPGVSEKEGKDLIWVTRENGQIKTYDKDPGSTWWDRTLVAFFGLLPIEGQL